MRLGRGKRSLLIFNQIIACPLPQAKVRISCTIFEMLSTLSVLWYTIRGSETWANQALSRVFYALKYAAGFTAASVQTQTAHSHRTTGGNWFPSGCCTAGSTFHLLACRILRFHRKDACLPLKPEEHGSFSARRLAS